MTILSKLITAFVAASATAAAYEAGLCESLVGNGTVSCLTSSPCGDNECAPTAGSCLDGQCLDVMGDPSQCEVPSNKCGDVFCPDIIADGTCFCDSGLCKQLQLPCSCTNWDGNGACMCSDETDSGDQTKSSGSDGESLSETAPDGSGSYEAGACESLVGNGTVECLTSTPCGDNQCAPTTGSCQDGQCLDLFGEPSKCEVPTNKCGDVFCPGVTAGGKCFCESVVENESFSSTCKQLQLPCSCGVWGGAGECTCSSGVVAKNISLATLAWVVGIGMSLFIY